jgi:hypothetical protein
LQNGNVQTAGMYMKERKHQKCVLLVNIHKVTMNFGVKIIKNK